MATKPNDNRVSCNTGIGIATTGTPLVRGALAVLQQIELLKNIRYAICRIDIRIEVR